MSLRTIIPKYFVSAYATSQVLHAWDEAAETLYFQGLIGDPRIAGIEIPFLLDREAYPIEWLRKNIPPHWHLTITSLPAVMQLGDKNSKAGLASNSEPDRKIAVSLIDKVRQYAERLQQAFGRPLIKSINLYSSPRNSAMTLQGSKEALERSLAEITKMNWGSIALNLEHCDAFTLEHPAEKGFLSLTDEIEVLESVGSIGLVLNWGRSAIETHSTEGPLQHLLQALSHQLLRGFVFSGCTSDPQSLYGAWKDKHAPPQNLSSQSTAAAKGFVAPVLAPSSTLSTLTRSLSLVSPFGLPDGSLSHGPRPSVFLRCAPEAPCPSSAAATLKTGSQFLCSESLLGEKEISAVLELLKNQELLQSQNKEFYLGIKISNRSLPFGIQRSLAWNLKTIELLEDAMKKLK